MFSFNVEFSRIRIVIALLAWIYLIPCCFAQEQGQKPDLNQQAVVETSDGTFVLSFHPDKASRHVELFLRLAREGVYDGTLFHRVIKWGLAQGGDPLSKDAAQKALWGAGGMNKTVQEISDLKHIRGTLSAVLMPGKPDSSGNQFFVCVTPQPQLDGQFSAFGFVAEGIEVVDKISETPIDEKGAPLKPPVIRKITLRPAQPVPPMAFSDVPLDVLARYRVRLETSLGDIIVGFFPELAPEHVRNFLRLAQAGFYDGTAFHRVVPDFVAQGGLLWTRQPPLPEFRAQDLVRRLKAEFNSTRHIKGILSMARYGAPDSADTSFFICLGEATSLDGEYTVFGKVIEGMDVLDKIQKVELDGETPKQRLELKKAVVLF
jgi:peptidyl-prolyl cis-trans isomerase B (cyclophilin B)